MNTFVSRVLILTVLILGVLSITTDRTDPDVYLAIGDLFSDANDPGSAVLFYEKAIAMEKTDSALTALGFAYLNNGQTDRAEAAFTGAIELNESNHVALYGLSTIHLDQERYLIAEQEARKATSIEPRRPEYYDVLGLIYANTGMYEEAVQTYQRGIRSTRPSPMLHNGLGYAYSLRGNQSLAQREYEKALKIDPSYEPAKRNLGLT